MTSNHEILESWARSWPVEFHQQNPKYTHHYQGDGPDYSIHIEHYPEESWTDIRINSPYGNLFISSKYGTALILFNLHGAIDKRQAMINRMTTKSGLERFLLTEMIEEVDKLDEPMDTTIARNIDLSLLSGIDSTVLQEYFSPRKVEAKPVAKPEMPTKILRIASA